MYVLLSSLYLLSNNAPLFLPYLSLSSSREVCGGGRANIESGSTEQPQNQLPHHRVCGGKLWCYCASKELLFPSLQVSWGRGG